MKATTAVFAAVCSLLPSLASAQAGPNTLAQYNPSNRTMSVNGTFCIVPIDKADARTITGYAPLNIPSSVLPTFPADKHPLIVQATYENDIRMTAANKVPLQIASLMQGSLIVPYSDATKDGKTPIGVPVNFYIGGTNGQTLQDVVPSVASTVSPFEGTLILPATFVPDTAAVQSLSNGSYSIEVKLNVLPNTVSGPGVYAEAFDILYALTQQSPYTAHTFHTLLNQPQLLIDKKCQRNTVYFNETFADPKMVVGTVRLYHETLGTPPANIEGVYTNVYCYQANGELVATVGESCAAAAAEVDPAAQQ